MRAGKVIARQREGVAARESSSAIDGGGGWGKSRNVGYTLANARPHNSLVGARYGKFRTK